MNSRKIEVAPSVVAWCLALVAALLVAVNMAMQIYRLATGVEQLPGLAMFTLDGENNLPALFSTALLFTASVLLAFIAWLAHKDKAADVSKWVILAVGFLLMGLDESLSLHERLIDPLRARLGAQHLGVFFFAWVIPGIVLVVALGAFFLRFLLRLPRRTGIAFLACGALYLGGALGVELIEGWWREGHGHKNLMYHVLVSLEEGLEMIGAILFIRALLSYLGSCFGDVRIAFHAEPSAIALEVEPAPARSPQSPSHASAVIDGPSLPG